MSHKAITWALQQTLADPGMKLVLIELANLAGSTNEAYPGAHYLAGRTAQDVTKVRADLAALNEAGLIANRGPRMGRRGGCVWRLAVDGPVENYVDPI